MMPNTLSREELLDEVVALRKLVQAKQEQWRLFSLATTNLLWNWSFEDNTVERSIGFEAAFGYSRDEIQPGIDWWLERLHPADKGRVMDVFGRTRDEGGARCSYEYRFQRRNGSYAHIKDNAFLLYNEEGRPLRALGAMTDISERVRMEEALRESEGRLRRTFGGDGSQRGAEEPSERIFIDVQDTLRLATGIIANLSEGIVLVRQSGEIVLANPRFEKMFGYPPGELLGQPIERLDANPSAERSREIEQSLAQGQSWRGEVENISESGRRFWCRITVSRLETAEFGEVQLAVFTDITAERQTAERQRLLTEELDHRVKNNLASIIGLATQTARRADGIVEFSEAFTARLHAMARVHEALANEGWGALPLSELIDETVCLHALPDQRVGKEGPDCVLSSAEVSALGLAFHELATNAVKHGALSQPDGQLAIRWSAEDGSVKVLWIESGGAPPEVNSQRGFGLQLVQGLIEHELGGTIESEFRVHGVHHELRIPRSPR